MAALIERASQSDPRLHRKQHTPPRCPLTFTFLQPSHAASLSNPYSWCSPPKIRSGHDLTTDRKPVSVRFYYIARPRLGNAWSQGGVWPALVVVAHPRGQDFS
jgi:hypothetical protein